MLLFVGLGNPGAKYAGNRHNIGFMALDRIAADHGFGPWKAKFQGEIAEGQLGGQKVMLLKPGTFMNLSGQSVGEAMRFFKLLNSLRFLRGTLLDPFRNTDEAKLARALLAAYEADIDFVLSNWSPEKAGPVTELLDLPEHIRGYGHVRERHAAEADKKRETLRDRILSSEAAAA